MDWKAQLDKATAAIKGVAESDKMKNLTAKAKDAASGIAAAAKKGAHAAADAVAKATSDPSTLRITYMGMEISIVSPSDGLQITRAHAGALTIADGAGNALVVNLESKPQAGETVGTVAKLDDTTYDLGAEDGVNVVVLKG
jgi:hypothetical protein